MLVTLALGLLQSSAVIRRASVELTPNEALPLGGYTARGGKMVEPGGEALHARVTVLEQGSTKIAVVAVDMLTIPESLKREVSNKVPKDIRLFLIATHTHCAPDSQMLNDRMTFAIPGIASFKSRWLAWYAEHISAGIQAALQSKARPVEMWETGTSMLALNRGRRIGALPDATGTLISAVLSARREPLWFHYAAHAVFWGPERLTTSGDWPSAVTGKLGADVLVGAIGDVSPAASGTDPEQRIANFAQTVAHKLDPQLDAILSNRSRISWVEVPIALDKQAPHPEFAKTNHIPEPLAQSLVDKFAPKEATISAFRIGKIAFVGVPGEPTSHLGRRIRDFGRNLGFDHVLVCSHVNGWMGYILDARDYARGGYEATLSMYGPGEGDKVVEAGKEALRRLAQTTAR